MMSLAPWCAALQSAGIAARIVGDVETVVTGVSIDTRTIASGEMYVALRGERFDGHDFAADAGRRGAAALLVERGLPLPQPQLVVPDTCAALGAIAAHWRRRFAIPLIAVVGSNGKTTTTQMIAAVFAHAYGERDGRPGGFATRGNRNNEIGVPLMLLELDRVHRAAVLELGMNHPGEIEVLGRWAQPTVTVVTNAQREHQEFLDSVAATARENGSAIAALPAGGTAIFPGDDPCAPIWRELAAGRPTIEFALARDDDEWMAAVRSQPPRVRVVTRSVARSAARSVVRSAAGDRLDRLEIAAPWGDFPVALATTGEHNARNALAAAAACLAIGIAPAAIARGLSAFRPVAGRGVVQTGRNGATVIDDSYNANPDSVRAAIDLLAGQPGGAAIGAAADAAADAAECAPARILILGDMGETGARSVEFHREVGAYARARGVDRLLALGEMTRETVAAFGAGATHFATIDDLIAAATGLTASQRSFLVKGSRFMRMERVVAALRHQDDRLDDRQDQPPGAQHVVESDPHA